MSTPVGTHNTAIVVARYDMPADYNDLYEVCETLARAKSVVPEYLRESPEDIFAVALLARSLDIAMWPAMHGLYVTKKSGMGMYVKLARALAERAGYTLTPLDADDPEKVWRQKYAQVEITPPGGIPFVVTYAYAEAVMAKLTHKDNWVENPVAMMFARAFGRALNWKASAVTLGIAIRDDMYEPDPSDPKTDTSDDSYTGMADEAVAATMNQPTTAQIDSTAARVEELAGKASRAKTIGGLNKILGTATHGEKQILLSEQYGGVTLGQYITGRIKSMEPNTDSIRKKGRTAKSSSQADDVLECGCFAADLLLEGGVHNAETCTLPKKPDADDMWAGGTGEPEDFQPAEEETQ